jgi:hypothetical protein
MDTVGAVLWHRTWTEPRDEELPSVGISARWRCRKRFSTDRAMIGWLLVRG